MNKKKMGSYLRSLRKEKKISLEKLSEVFLEDNLVVSINAISSWENGKTIPDIDNLVFLSNYYGVSIDDILDGEKCEVNFDEIYTFAKPNSDIDLDELIEDSLHIGKRDQHDEQVKILSRFKELSFRKLDSSISHIENKEWLYLIKNFYLLKEEMSLSTFLNQVEEIKKSFKNLDEKWWELQKYVFPIETLRKFGFEILTYGEYDLESADVGIEAFEKWHLDYLLSLVQTRHFIGRRYDPYGKVVSKGVDDIRGIIKFLVKHGAMLNDLFLEKEEEEYYDAPIIDDLEELYGKIIKPIPYMVNDECWYAENTNKNYFYIVGNKTIVEPLVKCGFKKEELYDLFMSQIKGPFGFSLSDKKKIGEYYGLDTNSPSFDYDFDNNERCAKLSSDWFGMHIDLHFREDAKKRYEKLKALLMNGQTTIKKKKTNHSLIRQALDRYEISCEKKDSLSLEEFEKYRNIIKTKQMMDQIDSISIKKIREKYFADKEVKAYE